MDWLLASGAAEGAQRLAAALYFFWYTPGLFVTGLRWLRAALAAEGQVEPMVRLRAEVGLAQLAFIAGDYMASFTAIESAVPTARLLGDDVVLARCLATAGYVWWLLDPQRSAALFEEGLEAAHRGGDGWTRSTGLAGLGWARYFAGSFDAALDSLEAAIQLTARSGRRQQFAMAILGRAAVELSRGQLAAADASAQQALGVLRAIGDATWTSAALAVGAEIERARGRLEEAGHRVITFDNRGCGRSAAPPAPYRVADMAADTAALIEYLGLGPCDVIGYSLGGYIAQQLAVTCPDLVRRLVLVAGVGAAPAYALARARAAVDLALALDPLPSSFDVADLLLSLHSLAQLQNDDDAVKVTISLIEAGGPWTNPGRLGQYQADLAWLEDSSHLDRLDRIKSPSLAMAFEHDCWFPPRAVREAAERIPGCRYAELPGLGHGAPLLAADQVNPILVEFLGTGRPAVAGEVPG